MAKSYFLSIYLVKVLGVALGVGSQHLGMVLRMDALVQHPGANHRVLLEVGVIVEVGAAECRREENAVFLHDFAPSS